MEHFELIHTEFIGEIDTRAAMYRHKKTGANILSMENNDENKCFGIAFRTPPSDSTGVAHILEHSVLCGSRKYPVKDPFVQLLKGSLQTFLNAFTFPDKTCYPVASQNLKDFHNLVDVYLDAVFYPRITRDFFMQEGWHLVLQDPEAELQYKGVVYNEMKGVYSSPDSLLMETAQQSLFPDTTYGLDSGGHPKQIPELTYKQFKAFHEDHYHPSNAQIFFYGNDPVEDRFALLENYLKDFQPKEPDSAIRKQPPLTQKVLIEKPYAVSADETNPKPMFTCSWLLPEPTHAEDVFALTLLDQILLGSPASPLRKALFESGLGEDLTGGGMETHMLQMIYSIGLKGVEARNLDKAQQLIVDTLSQLVQDGIDPNDVEAALNTFEFELRENNTGGFPRGLSIWLKSLNSSLYGGNPLELVAFEEPLKQLKENICQSGYLEGLIQRHFLENTHRSTVILQPDATISRKIEKDEKDRLARIRESMSTAEVQAVMNDTKRLLELQATPDDEEALASIPLLERNDLDREISTIEREEHTTNEVTVLSHALSTSGIVYLDIGLNLHDLDKALLPYASILGNLLLEMGTQTEDYVSLSQRISKKTGGIYGSPMLSAQSNRDRGVARFFLRSKCMKDQLPDLLDILHDILLQPDFTNRERFRQIVLEHKSELETSLVPRGHSAVMTRLKAHHHEAHWAGEMLGGVESLFFIRRLAEQIESDWPRIKNEIDSLRRILVNRSQIVINLTTDREAIPHALQAVENFTKTLPHKTKEPAIDWQIPTFPKREALMAPTRVNYVGCAANLYDCGYSLHGSALVITRYLQTAWLWEKIRVQGGAYGGMCSFDQRSGVFCFASYRDPNLEQSLETYLQTGTFLKELVLSEEELTRSLIGAIGQLDHYQLPDAKGYSSCARYLLNYSDAERQKLRNEVLNTNQAHFNTFGEVLIRAFEQSAVSVLCSTDTADKSGLEVQTRVL